MKIEITKILCPVDFSENAEYAVRYALVLAEAHDAEVILLQVKRTSPVIVSDHAGPSCCELDPDSTIVPGLEESDGNRLAALEEDLKQRHACRITARQVAGRPVAQIVRTAEEQDADLIVMGMHGGTRLRHLLVGSAAEKVVRMSPCPVLTVKHEPIMS